MALPDRFDVTGMLSRRGADADALPPRLDDVRELLATRPDLVIVTAPPEAREQLVDRIVATGTHVLLETPPATERAGLERIAKRAASLPLVHVAEQYPRHPMTAARIAAIRAGAIGVVSSAEVSQAQTYHAVAVLRAVLDAGRGPVTVRAVQHTAPLVGPYSRTGWTGETTPMPSATTLATIDFGASLGRYDFTDGQTRNPLRSFRFLARGSTGELVDDRIVALTERDTVVDSMILRRDLGGHGDFERRELVQITLDGTVLWQNAFFGAGLSDEELAITDMLAAAVAWARDDGPGPYPLDEAIHDAALGLAIDEAASTGRAVRVEPVVFNRDHAPS